MSTAILSVGSSVNIKRSDGRVHSAVVTQINHEKNCANVEWYENEETKGKEVDFDAILLLNPEFNLKPKEEVRVNNLQRNPTCQSMAALHGARRITMANRNGTAIPNADRTAIPQSIPTARTSTVRRNRRETVSGNDERLDNHREERTNGQVLDREPTLLKKDCGHPHWKLLNMITEYRWGLEMKPLTGNDPIEDHLITVCVRKRPFNQKEITKKEVDVITIPSRNQLIMHEPKKKVDLTQYLENQKFRFDYAFDETCNNEIVYKYTAQPLIKTIFEGGFATCFAYGQTGSGKTHTMGGDFKGKDQDCQNGIYAMAASDVFRLASSSKYRELQLLVSSSFFEIYSEKVYDLLNNKSKLKILEDGKQQVQVVGLTERAVYSTEDVLKIIREGNRIRTSGQTSANANSSRSHAVFQIILRSSNKMSKVHGQFSLIDLAGNERGADNATSNQQTRMEGAEINKSLLALKECIRALGRKGGHRPFRLSKLTQVLKDSFVGSKSRTCMIAMISPGISSCDHSLNTLRYADRVKELASENVPTNNDAEVNDEENIEDTFVPEKEEALTCRQDRLEETLLENQKQMIYCMREGYYKSKQLFQDHEEGNYDPEAYWIKWKQILNGMIDTLTTGKQQIEDSEKKITATEEQSKRKQSIRKKK